MLFSEFKAAVADSSNLEFVLPSGALVPAHFHLTELGQISKRFIDCGGTIRSEQSVSMQLYYASDVEHRLTTSKLSGLIESSQHLLNIDDAPVVVEYQGSTIESYAVQFESGAFKLMPLHTDCLAKDKCGIPELTVVDAKPSSCAPGSGCC
ncbi:MAG: hypothetical protein ACI959_000726 [Limisphaerales bacterium]|jgi:hypothetical protein